MEPTVYPHGLPHPLPLGLPGNLDGYIRWNLYPYLKVIFQGEVDSLHGWVLGFLSDSE